jgi:predicted transposase/invertase (TIGR01784 family)
MANKKLHDKLFRKSLGNIAIAKDFIVTHVPQQVLAKFDLNTIEFYKTSYIEDNLKEKITDIVYHAKMVDGASGYLFFLLEHQSTASKIMPFRILKYQVAIIADHLEQHPHDKLPVVFPMLYYCGEDKPYPHTLNVLDLFNDYTLAEQTLAKPIHLIDVTIMPDEVIMQHKLIGLLELVQKHIRDTDFSLIGTNVKHIITNITNQQNINHGLLKYIKVNLYYIILLGNLKQPKKFLKQLEEVPTIRGEIMGTLARYFEDGGIEKGKLKQAKFMALNMLKDGQSYSNIAKYTGLTIEEIKNLQNMLNSNHEKE